MEYTKIVDGVSLPMTEEEIAQRKEEEAAYLAEEPQRLAKAVRTDRNALLADTDWMALSDNTMPPAWASYRQSLRDITDQEGFPHSVVWPTKPE